MQTVPRHAESCVRVLQLYSGQRKSLYITKIMHTVSCRQPKKYTGATSDFAPVSFQTALVTKITRATILEDTRKSRSRGKLPPFPPTIRPKQRSLSTAFRNAIIKLAEYRADIYILYIRYRWRFSFSRALPISQSPYACVYIARSYIAQSSRPCHACSS